MLLTPSFEIGADSVLTLSRKAHHSPFQDSYLHGQSVSGSAVTVINLIAPDPVANKMVLGAFPARVT